MLKVGRYQPQKIQSSHLNVNLPITGRVHHDFGSSLGSQTWEHFFQVFWFLYISECPWPSLISHHFNLQQNLPWATTLYAKIGWFLAEGGRLVEVPGINGALSGKNQLFWYFWWVIDYEMQQRSFSPAERQETIYVSINLTINRANRRTTLPV